MIFLCSGQNLNLSTKSINTVWLIACHSTFSSFSEIITPSSTWPLLKSPFQKMLKVTRPSYFVRVPSYFEALWYSQCHASLRSESKFCCCRQFFVKISRLRIVRVSALRWTDFHQNRKDPMREIQRFPNLGHNLCKNENQLYTIISNKLWDLSLYLPQPKR